ncbi:hypothetical protein [Sphingobium lactosutens]|uniref:hypothetical protein n=1 Tax=Sphingobium lactosutens TaxID=522773 RepID=UPI0012680CAB|nr:hypothetical protein [Sphingobium lactosutens]
MKPLEFHQSNDLFSAQEAFKKLVSTGILSSEGVRSPWFDPVITKLLILLSDLLKAADRIGKRCTFTNDILVIDDEISSKITDVTDLIIRCRAAACHIRSGNQLFETNKLLMCVGVGKCDLISIGEKTLGCEYDDDIAVIWGPMRLYLRRHMMRAFEYVESMFPDPRSCF